jgi:hypothetical protein
MTSAYQSRFTQLSEAMPMRLLGKSAVYESRDTSLPIYSTARKCTLQVIVNTVEDSRDTETAREIESSNYRVLCLRSEISSNGVKIERGDTFTTEDGETFRVVTDGLGRTSVESSTTDTFVEVNCVRVC